MKQLSSRRPSYDLMTNGQLLKTCLPNPVRWVYAFLLIRKLKGDRQQYWFGYYDAGRLAYLELVKRVRDWFTRRPPRPPASVVALQIAAGRV